MMTMVMAVIALLLHALPVANGFPFTTAPSSPSSSTKLITRSTQRGERAGIVVSARPCSPFSRSQTTLLLLAPTAPEYELLPDDASPSSVSSSSLSTRTPSALLWVAVTPGTVMPVQIGDVTLARKAWKKRRRSDSPLLLPCSILRLDRHQAVRNNIWYLLQKFGTQVRTGKRGLRLSWYELAERHKKVMKSSLQRHMRELGYPSPASFIQALFSNPSNNFNQNYNKEVQLENTNDNEKEEEEADDITTTITTTTTPFRSAAPPAMVVEWNAGDHKNRSMWYVEAPGLSRFRARQRARDTILLQFSEQALVGGTVEPVSSSSSSEIEPTASAQDEGNHIMGNNRMWYHTGLVSIKRSSSSTDPTTRNGQAKWSMYQPQPLSAALRVNPKLVLDTTTSHTNHDVGLESSGSSGSGLLGLPHLQTGSIHSAVVLQFDARGDAGQPLVTLTLNPQQQQQQQQSFSTERPPRHHVTEGTNGKDEKINQNRRAADEGYRPTHHTNNKPAHLFSDLQVGQGPLTGTVVKFFKGGALVDCHVGRRLEKTDQDMFTVLGNLYFKDAVAVASPPRLTTNRPELDERESFANDDDDDDEDGYDDNEEDWDEILSVTDLADENEIQAAVDKATRDTDDDEEEDEFDDDDFADAEDITHLCEYGEDGILRYHDPETGETIVIDYNEHEHDHEHDDDDDDDDDDDEDDDILAEAEHDDDHEDEDEAEMEESDDDDDDVNLKATVSPRNRDKPGRLSTKVRRQTLHIGDRVDVYVKSISKKSGQLILTMNPSVQGRNAKELKLEGDLNKKLSRLAKQLGGLDRLKELTGQECDGLVQATSNAGEWCYVKPQMDGLPVGVASAPAEIYEELQKGDSVRLAIEGLDQGRGQLSLRILRKLAP